MRRRRRYATLAVLTGLAVGGIVLARAGVAADVVAVLAGPLLLPALVGIALIRPFLAWPVSLLSLAIGYVLGFPAGVPVALGVTVLTCLPPFLVARQFGRTDGLLGRLARAGNEAVSVAGDLRGTTAARLSPAPADAVSYAAGISGVSLPAFIAGTVLGEVPWAMIYVLLGASLGEFTAKGISTVNPPFALLVAASVVALALFVPPLVRALR